jgi:hypothetical protein
MGRGIGRPAPAPACSVGREGMRPVPARGRERRRGLLETRSARTAAPAASQCVAGAAAGVVESIGAGARGSRTRTRATT